MNTIQLLSTVKELRYEDAGGKVLGRIQRDKRGKCVLMGERPTDRPHYQVVVYFDFKRAEDKTFVPSRTVPAPTPAPAWRDTSVMRPTRAD